MAKHPNSKLRRKGRSRREIRFDERLRYSIVDSATLLGISRALLYERIRAGTLKTIHDGGRHFVPGSEILRLSALPGTQ
jgi:hypothetical protein